MTSLANPKRIIHEVLAAAWMPAPPVDYLRFAQDHITFGPGDSFPGKYNKAAFPYFDGVLEALSPEAQCRYVTLVGSAQIGKTVLGNIFALGSIVMGRGTTLVCHPTIDNALRWSKIKLQPMMRSIPEVQKHFPQRPRDTSDALLYKERADGLATLLITGANSPASLSQITVNFQVQDDLSKWENNTAGDPETQADSRSRAVEFAKILKTSTPMILPGCRITKDFEAGSQEMPYVPCPHCAHMQVLTWDNMLALLDPEHPEDACFSCIACGCIIEERHRPQMLAGFEWRAKNPAARREHRSFYIWSAYSCLQSWARIAQEWLKARGDPGAEQTFINDTVGLAYKAQSETTPWEGLRDRAAASDYVRGTVPKGALLLMLGIDCQGDRVEWQLVGFGKEYRRYVVDYGIIDRHISDMNCQRNLTLVMQRQWRNQYGRGFSVDFTAIDGNAWTEDVWSFARQHPSNKLMMVRGRGDDAAPRLARVTKERNAKTGLLIPYSKRFYHLGVSGLKMALYRDLQKTDPEQPGYVAFPSGLDDEYFQELVSERRTSVKRNGFTVYRWTKDDRQDNECLDTMIQATGAALRYGVYGLSDVGWTRLELERGRPAPPQVKNEVRIVTPEPPSPAWSNLASINKLTISPAQSPSSEFRTPDRR